MLAKSNAFYDCLTRVPLLFSWPGHLPAGERHPELVSTIDVMPTILQLAGVPLPDDGRGIHGRQLPGTPGAPPARDSIFAEYGAGGPAVTLEMIRRLYPPGTTRPINPLLREREGQGHAKMVRTLRWKYTHDTLGEADELYDLESDPWELTNLLAPPPDRPPGQARDLRYADVVGELRLRLVDWCLETEDARPVPLRYPPFA
jgi:arylsulfatase A-like enzyme